MPESLASGKLWKLYLCWRSCSEVKNLQVIWMWHQTIQTHSSLWFWALLIFGSYSSVWPGIIPLTAITIELQLYDMQGFVRNQCIFSFLFKECNTSVIPPTEMRTHIEDRPSHCHDLSPIQSKSGINQNTNTKPHLITRFLCKISDHLG